MGNNQSTVKRLKPEEDAKWWCQDGLDKDGFEVKYISDYKGFGVFAEKDFRAGDFLLEYVVEILTEEEALERQRKCDENNFFRRIKEKICGSVQESLNGIQCSAMLPVKRSREDSIIVRNHFRDFVYQTAICSTNEGPLPKLQEKQREIRRLEVLKEQQKTEDSKKQKELEEKLRELKLQQQNEKDEEERKRRYLEPLETPWRHISLVYDDPWNKEFKKDLQFKINTLEPAGGIKYFNILLLGQAASGKSSFFNTCHTALMDDNRLMTIQQVYQGASSSVSTCVEATPMRTKGKKHLPVRLFDCRGLDMKFGVPTEDIRLIIHGHVKSGYSINPAAPITKDHEKYRENPTDKDVMHCIVYVATAVNPSENLTDEETKKQLNYVREKIALQHLPQLVLFTNIDKIRISNTNNLRDIFRSRGVKDICHKAAKYMEIPLMNVLPMSNYHDENMPTLEKDILALFYLLTMMQRAKDYAIRLTGEDVPEDFYD